MNADREEIHRRYQDNLEMGRDLAARLARGAEQIADTLDHLARVHEDLATVAGHPLAGRALERAAGERAMAERERASSLWFRELASRPTCQAGA